jgi:hypothetical protein
MAAKSTAKKPAAKKCLHRGCKNEANSRRGYCRTHYRTVYLRNRKQS